VPARPTPFRVAFDVVASGQAVTLDVPVNHRYENSLFVGEKRMEVQVVPAFAVTADPEIAVFPVGAAPVPTRAAATPTTREIRVDTQAVIQQQLLEIGIGTDLQNFDSDIFFAGYGENGPAATFQLDIFEYSNSPAFPDADSVEWLCSEIPSDENPAGSNWSGYCDEELDALFKQQAAQVDFTERQATFFQITRHIFDNVYWLGYWQDPDLFGINARLLNVKLSGASPFFNAIEWDIAQ
jgi:ABC-type transport system substrate-binding protein